MKRMAGMALLLFVAGCATVSLSEDQQKFVLAQGQEVFGANADFQAFFIPSRGGMADSVFIAQSVSSGPSGLAREIAEYLGVGETKDVEIIVSGPSGGKNVQVIKDAFSFFLGKKLTHLKFMYVGLPEHKAAVERAVTSHGATFYYKERST